MRERERLIASRRRAFATERLRARRLRERERETEGKGVCGRERERLRAGRSRAFATEKDGGQGRLCEREKLRARVFAR